MQLLRKVFRTHMAFSFAKAPRLMRPVTLGARSITTEAAGLNNSLAGFDPELHGLISAEKGRQSSSICLIPSENFAPRYVLEAVGSVLMNKYSEGYPGMRYYGGNEIIDEIETLCQRRALEAFHLPSDKWAINVQPHSGSPANFAVYTALLNPHDRLMGLDLTHGGHLSHGFQTPSKKVSAVANYFECMAYRLDEETGLIDYDELEQMAVRFRPKILIAGTSAYSRNIDYKRMRQIADLAGAYLLADMAHISGLVAAGEVPSPFEYADVVTTTTHKTLRGPRGALIFCRKGLKAMDKRGSPIYYDLEDKINSAVFPRLQGGPHNHSIAGIAAALKQAASPEFKIYQSLVKRNAKILGDTLTQQGFELVSNGTDNHLLLVNLQSKGLSGAKCEKICEFVKISLNKNTIPSDISAMNPNGIRLGSSAMTSRGLDEGDFEKIGKFLSQAVDLGLDIQQASGPKLADFTAYLQNAQPFAAAQLRKEVEEFASQFPVIG